MLVTNMQLSYSVISTNKTYFYAFRMFQSYHEPQNGLYQYSTLINAAAFFSLQDEMLSSGHLEPPWNQAVQREKRKVQQKLL